MNDVEQQIADNLKARDDVNACHDRERKRALEARDAARGAAEYWAGRAVAAETEAGALRMGIEQEAAETAKWKASFFEAQATVQRVEALLDGAVPDAIPCPDHQVVGVGCDWCWAYAGGYESIRSLDRSIRAALKGTE